MDNVRRILGATEKFALVLAYAQHISVGGLEPSHFRAAGSAPDAEFVLFHPGITLELNSGGGESAHRRGDVGHVPPEDGIRGQHYVAHDRHAQHGAMRVEYHRELVFGNQGQPEYTAIKSFGARGVAGGDERNDWRSGKHVEKDPGCHYK